MPRSVRQVLKFETGTNDIIVLPVILVLISVASASAGGAAQWTVFMLKLLVLEPVIGFATGGVGSWLMNEIDASLSIREEHRALYGVGLAVVILNQSLC